jgi:ComF family protein
MARLFWGQIPIERAAALFYYEAQSEVAQILYKLKYENHPEVGEVMGRLVARELHTCGFFDGIDGIVAVPLTRRRQHQRGYNQSLEIAHGIRAVTGLTVYDKAVRRMYFKGSQTTRGRWERNENVERVFELVDGKVLHGQHILIVDDVVTTGATAIACAKELVKAGDVRISVLSLGFAKT